MKTQFTKGEWQYALHMDEHYKGKRVVVDDGTKYHRVINICDVYEHPQKPEESNANAKLIAAAPDLLQACQNLSWALSQLTDAGFHREYYEMVQAIKKATE